MNNNLNKEKDPKENRLSIISDIIQSICSIISVAFIGIITLLLMIQQNNLSNLQNDISNKNNLLYEAQMSPHFRTKVFSVTNKIDGFEWDEVIQIQNYGGNYYTFDSYVFSFIIFNQAGNTYAIPMSDYYFYFSETNNVTIEHFTNCKIKFKDLIDEANDNLKNKNSGDSYDSYWDGYYDGVVTYVKISYQNIFGEEKIQYFKARDSRLLDNDTGEKYYNLSRNSVKIKGVEYSSINIDLELMLEFANTDLKNQYAIDIK